MAEESPAKLTLLQHGATHLPAVDVDAYNAEMRDSEGFIGDRASNRAFRSILEEWRERLREVDDDPLGDIPSDKISKKKIDKVLAEGDPEAAGLVTGVIEEFAQEFVSVIHRLLRLKTWRDTERIVVGGGFRDSRTGEIVIGRTEVILKKEGHEIDLKPITNHPDQAALIGAVHLAPSWVFEGFDAILAVDIGGSNIRAGVVELHLAKNRNLSAARVWDFVVWQYAEEKPSRDQAVARTADMLRHLIAHAEKKKLALAPFVGIGCPGLIREDGSIERGGQNLPGNWESKRFNLPHELQQAIPSIGPHQALFLMHNDAVVQGLSELPHMEDVNRWAVLTIGTGLGNAHFTNRRSAGKQQ